jgi:hypothetical protein
MTQAMDPSPSRTPTGGAGPGTAALAALVAGALLCAGSALAVRSWTSSAAQRLVTPEPEKPKVAIADQAEVAYCTPQFKQVLELSKKYRLYSTPLFLQFAAGERDYPCTPWGNVTRTPLGWKDPCYLIAARYFKTWDEFWTGVDWEYWEKREDPRCQNCMMHSGFEASVMRKLPESGRDVWTMAKWNFLS